MLGNESWWFSDGSNWHGAMRWRVYSRKIWHIMEHFYDNGWDVEWYDPPQYYVRWKRTADQKRERKEWQEKKRHKAHVHKLQRQREQLRWQEKEQRKLDQMKIEEEERKEHEKLEQEIQEEIDEAMMGAKNETDIV